MATAEMLELITAEQFGQRPDPGYPEEFVRKRIVAKSVPDRRHGYVCGRADRVFGNFVDSRSPQPNLLHRALRPIDRLEIPLSQGSIV